MDNERTEWITLTIDRETKRRILILAANEMMNLSEFMRVVIAFYLDTHAEAAPSSEKVA